MNSFIEKEVPHPQLGCMRVEHKAIQVRLKYRRILEWAGPDVRATRLQIFACACDPACLNTLQWITGE